MTLQGGSNKSSRQADGERDERNWGRTSQREFQFDLYMKEKGKIGI